MSDDAQTFVTMICLCACGVFVHCVSCPPTDLHSNPPIIEISGLHGQGTSLSRIRPLQTLSSRTAGPTKDAKKKDDNIGAIMNRNRKKITLLFNLDATKDGMDIICTLYS